jgi:DNA-binding CsgD family transcriptional regulator
VTAAAEPVQATQVSQPHFAPRELEIVSLISEGKSDKEIAACLGVSTRTVRTHLERLFARHGLHSRTAALTLWMRTRAVQ